MDNVFTSTISSLNAPPLWLLAVIRMTRSQDSSITQALRDYVRTPKVIRRQKLRDIYLQNVPAYFPIRMQDKVFNDDLFLVFAKDFSDKEYFSQHNTHAFVIVHRSTSFTNCTYSVLITIPRVLVNTNPLMSSLEGASIIPEIQTTSSVSIHTRARPRQDLFIVCHKAYALPAGMKLEGRQLCMNDISNLIKFIIHTPKKRLHASLLSVSVPE